VEETNDVVRRDGDARDDEEGGQDLPPHTHDEVKIFQPFLLPLKIKFFNIFCCVYSKRIS